MDVCNFCNIGEKVDSVRKRKETYRNVIGWINQYYSVCNHCGSKTESGWQINVNRDNHLYFHKLIEGDVLK